CASAGVTLAALVAFAALPCASRGQGATDKEDRIQPGDRLNIHATNTLPGGPIQGVFRVEPSGKVALGPHYGRLQIKGQTLEEAEAAIHKHLQHFLREPAVSVTRYDPLPTARDLQREGAMKRRIEEELEKRVGDVAVVVAVVVVVVVVVVVQKTAYGLWG